MNSNQFIAFELHCSISWLTEHCCIMHKIRQHNYSNYNALFSLHHLIYCILALKVKQMGALINEVTVLIYLFIWILNRVYLLNDYRLSTSLLLKKHV